MKYPRLKCEEKKNTVVCSLDIKKMKKMHKEKSTYQEIADKFKVSVKVVYYHISSLQNTPEFLEKRRKRSRERNFRLYHEDSEFRRKMLNSINKFQRKKYTIDSKFKKWHNQRSAKTIPIWIEKQKQKHPTWSSTCARGVHETTSQLSKCKNKRENCKCPCHRK